MEKQLKIAEENMNNDPHNIALVENYTSLLDQFNNI
jgi:hypothetical protein